MSAKNKDNCICMELALEGERLCKSGDCRSGVSFLEAALQAGTENFRTLAAIYNQLGNAYFYLGDFNLSLNYHNHDLTLARQMKDKPGEANASGNLGNTLKALGKFDEALICCKRHLDLSKELEINSEIGRALYNLANIYYSKGCSLFRGNREPCDVPQPVVDCLHCAIEYYDEYMELMVQLGDRCALGRALGSIGNANYLLGNFNKSIEFHQQRLKIAREFGDKAAERRAQSNLGNAHIFLGKMEISLEHFKRTLILSKEMQDLALEAQACFSLGNTHMLMDDFKSAVDYFHCHMRIARSLNDSYGEVRACWCLCKAYMLLSNMQKALYFANQQLELSIKIGDTEGESVARKNIKDIKSYTDNTVDTSTSHNGEPFHLTTDEDDKVLDDGESANQRRRKSMQNMDILNMTPEIERLESRTTDTTTPKFTSTAMMSNDECGQDGDGFLEHLRRSECRRRLMGASERRVDNDDQPPLSDDERVASKTNDVHTPVSAVGTDDLVNLIAGLQSRRMDEQRVDITQLPGFHRDGDSRSNWNSTDGLPDQNFFDLLMRCQGSRLDDQRSTPPVASTPAAPSTDTTEHHAPPQHSRTVPDDDLFSAILRYQSDRMDDQRSTPPFIHTLRGD